MTQNSEICVKRKKYLQSYMTMTTSIKVIENLIHYLNVENEEQISFLEINQQYAKIQEQIQTLTKNLGILLKEKQNLCEMMNYSLRQIYYIHNHALEHFSEIEKTL